MSSEYKVITASSAGELTKKVNELMEETSFRKWTDGSRQVVETHKWIPDGSHQVVETHRQNRYRGSDPIDTIITREYSQTMKKVI